MKEDYNALKKFQDTFINTNGRFYILEQRVPVKLQMEYFRYSERIRKDPDKNKLDYEVIQDVLSDPEMDAGQKKHVLSILATSLLGRVKGALNKGMSRASNPRYICCFSVY